MDLAVAAAVHAVFVLPQAPALFELRLHPAQQPVSEVVARLVVEIHIPLGSLPWRRRRGTEQGDGIDAGRGDVEPGVAAAELRRGTLLHVAERDQLAAEDHIIAAGHEMVAVLATLSVLVDA
ncbi:hypothetical protein D3C78_1657650 [compost metagenome]